MRVIAGIYRGRRLTPPKGDTTRPTTDRVREALMSSLNSIRGGFDGAVVLDAFAGSGALGVECLSRGAAYTLFCERDNSALRTLGQNTSFLPSDSFRVARTDVVKHPPCSPTRPFDLVFFDPPYATPVAVVSGIIVSLQASQSLAPDALIVYEHDKLHVPADDEAFAALELEQIAQKRYGETSISIFRKGVA